MRKSLTDLVVQRLNWNGKPTIYWDKNLPAFGVRINQTKKTFVIQVGEDRKLISIGHYPDLALKDARNEAKAQMIAMTAKGVKTPQNASQGFLEDVRRRLKKATYEQYKSYLDYVDLDLTDLSKKDIMEQIRKWEDKPTAQNYAYATIRAYLNWCIDQGYIESHPLIRGKAPNALKERSRVLRDEELGHIWRTTEDDTYGRILRLLILTGQRRAEVWKLKPEDINDGMITFHTKGDRINILPLTPLVEENLVGIPFTFNNWSGCKHRFDVDCVVQDWRLHDLRRTFATRLASLGVDFIIIEHLLGHAFGNKVTRTYQRYSYMDEKKEALLLWENHIRTLMKLGA